ncbi:MULTISPECIES: SNF2-related protein [Streptomyces]|uniref:Helicase ATP-binding domain-containing protein n=1 Tax=Streptomyces cadmiisoli TaxID=2184053 RepID=A0A2Z4J7L0_9ACTN|nr:MULTISPECIES: SNF2-related protein [Streptomyces]AWW41124.1 hypothetical protein DN051_34300 [Streptomyces cadmiisoli]
MRARRAHRPIAHPPLAVCHQTVEEAARLDTEIRYVRNGDQAFGPGVWITNYEMVERFDRAGLDAVVLDEASILKNHIGKTRTKLINHFAKVPYRLACTATPAPNAPQELTSQAEFLGAMRRTEMLATYFINDGKEWRLQHHGRPAMFYWMATWAAALRSPVDIGCPAGRYNLPPLSIRTHLVETRGLYALAGVAGRAETRAATVDDRVAHALTLVHAEPGEPWLLWAGRNDEADRLADGIPGAVNVHGSLSPEEKADHLLAFARGEIQHLVTKASIAGFGMNWQRCAHGVRRSQRLVGAVLPGHPPLLAVRPDPPCHRAHRAVRHRAGHCRQRQPQGPRGVSDGCRDGRCHGSWPGRGMFRPMWRFVHGSCCGPVRGGGGRTSPSSPVWRR